MTYGGHVEDIEGSFMFPGGCEGFMNETMFSLSLVQLL